MDTSKNRASGVFGPPKGGGRGVYFQTLHKMTQVCYYGIHEVATLL